MTKKLAILNVQDTGAVESLADMLERVGYRCVRPTMHTLVQLRNVGLEGILDPVSLHDVWGYDVPTVPMVAEWNDVCGADLFVDLKAHVNHSKIIHYIPRLKGKVLWYCLNGGDPLRRGMNEWADPPCPCITPNQWHRQFTRQCRACDGTGDRHPAGHVERCFECQGKGNHQRDYTFWPRFMRAGEYVRRTNNSNPICLVHNVNRWGYGHLVKRAEQWGVSVYGVNTGEGMITRERARILLEHAVMMVHLKVGDSVGWATLEAVAARCPIVCSQFYIDECKLGEFLIPSKTLSFGRADKSTCLLFDPSSEEAFAASLTRCMELLSDPVANASIAENAWARYDELTWNDKAGLAAWLGRNFR